VERTGGYHSDLRWHCDWFMNLVIGFREGVCHVPETLALISVRPNTYSAQGTKDEQAMRQVVTALLRRLNSQAYWDLIPFFQHSGVMEPFFPYLVQIAATPPVGRPNGAPAEAGLHEPDLQLRALAALFLAPLCDRAVRLRDAELKQARDQVVVARQELGRLWERLAGALRQAAEAREELGRVREELAHWQW
jgi:hypothetical protein